MSLLILFLFAISYFFFIWIMIAQFFVIKELREQINQMVKREEVEMKRIYKNLSDKLIEERDKLKNDLSSLRKKFNKNKKLIKSYIRWRISIDILISKFR